MLQIQRSGREGGGGDGGAAVGAQTGEEGVSGGVDKIECHH